MTYAYSVALIAPVDRRADANRLACALGHDTLPGNTFTIALSRDGQPPATHYGAHTFAAQTFATTIQRALWDQLPPIDWPAYGLTPVRVTQLFAAMTIVTRAAQTPAAWAAAMAETGLQRVATDETAK